MIEAAFALDHDEDDDGESVLEVDLAALQANYRRLCAIAASAECAAVVKADAYGLGLAPVALTLLASGCRTPSSSRPSRRVSSCGVSSGPSGHRRAQRRAGRHDVGDEGARLDARAERSRAG